MAEKIQFRLDEALTARLREHARKVGWNESQFARYLIATSLGDDARMAALSQIAWAISAKVQKNATRIGKALQAELQKLLEENDDGE